MASVEQRTMRKVAWRIPFLIVCYFISYLDRVNVGFAGPAMRAELGLSATAFGTAAGIFFLAYFVFEVPSNLALNRFGARLWIARIMFTWGLLSGAEAFVTGETSFNIVRVLLGAAEAGFFPGVIFYLTLWFPSAYRGRIIGIAESGMLIGGKGADLAGEALRVSARPTAKPKCVRCWHHRADVGLVAAHPHLCGRCVSNVEGPGERRQWF